MNKDMKRFLYMFSTVILAAAACEKPVVDDDFDISGNTVFTVDTEQIDILAGASFRDTWAEGSRLGVFGDADYSNIPYVLKRDGIDKSEATFYGPLVRGRRILAYYPYSASKELEEGMVPVTLSTVQPFDADADATSQFLSCSPEVVACTEGDNVLHFRYPFGIMAVQLQFDELMKVSSLTLSSTESGIAGRLLVDADLNVKASSISATSISVTPDTPVDSFDADGRFATFYFVLPPAEYPAKSLALAVVTETETMNISMKAIEVKRVDGVDFSVCNVAVQGSDLPGFNPVDGYLE